MAPLEEMESELLEKRVGMEEWSVHVESRGVDARRWYDEADVEALSEALEGHYPAVAGGPYLEARLSVEAGSAEEAASLALGVYERAIEEAFLGEERMTLAAVEAMTAERLEEEMFGVDEREVLLGVAEAADFLGVSKTRVGALRDREWFPRPFQELASGPVWRLVDLKGFEMTWDRKPGPKRARESLREARKAAGMKIGEVAKAVGLPKDVVIKLERGKLLPETIPGKLLERLGEVFGRPAEQIRLLVESSLGRTRAVFYKADKAPEEAGLPEAFEDALRESPYLDEDCAREWLDAETGS